MRNREKELFAYFCVNSRNHHALCTEFPIIIPGHQFYIYSYLAGTLLLVGNMGVSPIGGEETTLSSVGCLLIGDFQAKT